MECRVCTTGLSVVLSAAAMGNHTTADDEIVISPPFRLEAAADEDWWALEFAAAARRVQDAGVWRTEVIGMWMRDRSGGLDPELAIKTVRMGFTNDAGTSWEFEDFQASGMSPHEFDPMACFDPVSGSLYAGSMAGGHKDWISRLAPGDHDLEDFSALQLVQDDEDAHRPSAGAGPKPEAPTEHRVYISAIYDLTWSDNLGVTWSPILAQVGDGINVWAVPRVGSEGQLYLAHRYTPQGQSNQIRLDRSIELDDDEHETPLFLDESVVTTTNGFVLDIWVPSVLKMSDVTACAVAPHDGTRVYVAWLEKTSEEQNECDTTNHNVELYFSMTGNATVATPTWTTKKIVPANVEVPGDQFYPWLEATTFIDGEVEKTRLHLVWYDSRHNPDQCDTGMGNDQTFWFDVYYAYSDDEGATWNEHRLTEYSMNTAYALETFDGSTTFFGDYIGMAVVGKRAFPFASIATSILFSPSGPYGYSEAYTWMIVFGDRPSAIDFTVVEGTLTSADDINLITSSNDQRLVVEDATGSVSTPLQTIIDIELETDYTGVDEDDEIDIRFEGFADEADVTGRIYLKDQNSASGDWVLWNEFDVAQTGDDNSWVRMIPTVQTVGLVTKDYVSSTGLIDVRIEMTRAWQSGYELNSRIDYIEVVVVDND